MNALKDLKSNNREIKIDLSGLNINQLQDIIFEAQSLIRKEEFKSMERRKTQSKEMLKVGDVVSVDADRFKGEFFEVIKLNTKKVKCLRDNGETWNIPYASIIMQ